MNPVFQSVVYRGAKWTWTCISVGTIRLWAKVVKPILVEIDWNLLTFPSLYSSTFGAYVTVDMVIVKNQGRNPGKIKVVPFAYVVDVRFEFATNTPSIVGMATSIWSLSARSGLLFPRRWCTDLV
jgi:hypothetical protein